MDKKDYISKFQEHIGQNIKKLMKIQNITQKEMKEKCEKAGFDISQATISNAKRGQGNITISNLLAIAYALNVNIMEILDVPFSLIAEGANKKDPLLNVESEMLITNPESAYIKSYLGKFYVLFYKTSGTGEDMVEGTLEINPSKNNMSCEVVLRLDVNEITRNGEEIRKVYQGQLISSPAMRSVYIFLFNSQIGEVSMLLFEQIFVSYHQVETAMAVAITTASGANRRPTVHRMCISRQKVDAENLDYIKGQLLMNTSNIILTDEQIESLFSNNNIPHSIKELLKKATTKGHCYCISESSLVDASMSDDEQYKLISYVRSQSMSPKYNKISRKTDEILYNILGRNIKK